MPIIRENGIIETANLRFFDKTSLAGETFELGALFWKETPNPNVFQTITYIEHENHILYKMQKNQDKIDGVCIV